MASRRHRSYRNLVEGDLEMLPLMSLFIVLIPMLLLSAVFIHITVIDIASADGDAAEVEPPADALELAVRIQDDAYVVEGKSVAREVISRDDEAPAREQLAAVLRRIANAHPNNDDVRIVSEPETRYDDIIAVMDVSREAGLPLVSLAAAEEGS